MIIAMIKRIILVLGLLSLPFIGGLLFTYDIIKIEWISFMEIQPSFDAQEDPLPMPPRSVPIQGAMIIEGLAPPENPVAADAASVERGRQLYEPHCALCHGVQANGAGPFAGFLRRFPPANLVEGNAVNLSDGEIFIIISQGVPDRMPALASNLPTAQERWDIVNYIRSLQAMGGQ